MSGGMEVTGRNSHIQVPAGDSGGNAPVSSDGKTPIHKVTGPVTPDPQLSQLQKKQTPDVPITDRQTNSTPPSTTPGLKRTQEASSENPVKKEKEEETAEAKAIREAREIETMSEDELKAKQKEKLDEAAKVSDRYEEFSLLGRAKGALDNPKNAPKDLKVTIALPGKDPVTLIPWDDKLMERDDFQELWDTAKKVLAEHEVANFENYKAEDDFNKLSELKGTIKQIADKLGDNKYEEGERDHDNEWEKQWKEVRHKPVRLEAYEGLNRSDRTRVVVDALPESAQEKMKKAKGSESEPGATETHPENVTRPGENEDEDSALNSEQLQKQKQQ
ncbi:hypothetical protein [Endozoicomonas numazuensis]|uniref:Uncharacterized protein n=1 Tax=Endozoicomonas numazuensis TaxID=1137799 RepID=A0A081NL33_9GAMM|nr:hypothetical protein [Endozoicomonas numazuensis]KEQ19156.1 hypothetical protein GZ78_03925 [Endozoicomonas numazuensis]